MKTPPASLDDPDTATRRTLSTRSSCESAILSISALRHLIPAFATTRAHAAHESYAFVSASVHTVPCLIQRTSRCGVLVFRLSWGGNRTVAPCGVRVRIVRHSGHSTFETPVSAIWAASNESDPANEHLVTSLECLVSPTGSRPGERSPTGVLVGLGEI